MAGGSKTNKANKMPTQKVVKEGFIQKDIRAAADARYVFWSTKDRRISAGATFEEAMKYANIKGYKLQEAQ